SGTGSDFRRMQIYEFSGLSTTTALDQSTAFNFQNNAGTGQNAANSSTITPTTNGELILACNMQGGVGSTAAGTGYTANEAFTNGLLTEYQVQATAAPIVATYTDMVNAQENQTAIASFAVPVVAGVGNTYYVDKLLPGSNANSGLSEALPFLTIQKCFDVIL